MTGRRFFLRDFDAGDHLEAGLVSAIAAILVIRFFLHVTGYPQLGGDNLHIAHMLWGGLMMLVALIAMVTFVSRHVVRAAAILGGVGFGTFMDEVGKFVTQDNDYFYQPAVAIMYVAFVLLFLLARALLHGRGRTSDEYLLNAIRELEEVALRDLDEREQASALRYLEKCEPGHPLVRPLRNVLNETALVKPPPPGPLVRLRAWATGIYARLVVGRWFRLGVLVFFVLQFLVTLFQVLGLFWGDSLPERLHNVLVLDGNGPTPGFLDYARLSSHAFSGVFVLAGMLALRHSRLAAYIQFKRSVLVTLFLTQVFIFYEEEFSALLGFAFQLLVLAALNLTIDREREMGKSSDEDLAAQATPDS